MSLLVTAEYSEKGGVGKTSITNGLAAVAADEGMNVVVVDADPRGSATQELGIPEEDAAEIFTLNDLLFVPEDRDPVDPAEAIFDVLQPAGERWPSNVRVIAAERPLAHRENDIHPIEGRLARGLQALDGEVDLVVIDMPPRAGGRLVAAALTAAHRVIIPATLTTDGLAGAKHARRSIRLIRQSANPALEYMGIIRSIIPRQRERVAVNDLIEKHLFKDFPGEVLTDYPGKAPNLGREEKEGFQIPYYAVREDACYTSVPITKAGGREAKILVEQYRKVLDHLRNGKAIRV